MRPSFRNVKKRRKKGAAYYISFVFFILSVSAFVIYGAGYLKDMHNNTKTTEELRNIREQYKRETVKRNTPTPTETPTPTPTETPTPTPTVTPDPDVTPDPNETLGPLPNGDPEPTNTPSPTPTNTPTPTVTPPPPKLLPLGEEYLAINKDYVGWLELVDTNPLCSYPVVMEKPLEEEYYLTKDIYGRNDRNGTLFTVDECRVGVGTIENDYYGGEAPTTNILIFGHDMYSNHMFGNLSDYLKQEYYERHKYIYFDTAYENRTYEIIAIFRSHEYEDPFDSNFKYYFFYNADTEAQFDYWYSNIKSMSEINCKATAKFGDQFITLSTCSATDETGKKNPNGRLAVVAVRIE